MSSQYIMPKIASATGVNTNPQNVVTDQMQTDTAAWPALQPIWPRSFCPELTQAKMPTTRMAERQRFGTPKHQALLETTSHQIVFRPVQMRDICSRSAHDTGNSSHHGWVASTSAWCSLFDKRADPNRHASLHWALQLSRLHIQRYNLDALWRQWPGWYSMSINGAGATRCMGMLIQIQSNTTENSKILGKL